MSALSRATVGRASWMLPPSSSPLTLPVRHSKASKRRKIEQRRLAPHLAFSAREKTPSRLALTYFDDHYGKTFGRRWPSMRLAMLSPVKHCALVNNFGDVEETRAMLRGPEHGCVSLAEVAAKAEFPRDDEIR